MRRIIVVAVVALISIPALAQEHGWWDAPHPPPYQSGWKHRNGDVRLCDGNPTNVRCSEVDPKLSDDDAQVMPPNYQLPKPSPPKQINVALFTPPQMSGIKWRSLGENETDVFWYGYATVQGNHYIAIKDAVKGIGNEYSALFVTFADLLCGPPGHYPQALEEAHVDAYDLYHGWPVSDQQSPFGEEMPLIHGSAAAIAVIKSCDAIVGTATPTPKRKAEDAILN